MNKIILTQEILKNNLNYDFDTGKFSRLVANCNSVKIGDLCGSVCSNGYLSIRVLNKSYKAHRLAWLYMTGEWPKNVIDHVNGIKDDNRFCNLREATSSQNMFNCKLTKRNTSGFKGVSFNKRKNKFVAQIRINKKQTYLGVFDTAELASAKYNEFAKNTHDQFYLSGSL
jgi:hypothetical protein